MIEVTRPFLPPKHEYDKYLKQIWEQNWFTNDGPLVKQLESNLIKYLGVKNLKYVTNGTIALQLGIKALELTGEIITTPFSYVATTSSIVWEGCTPVFVDIDNSSFNIDPSLIENAITPKTTAIIATHVFGNPCDIDAIQTLAKKHNLRVIYDAAHCFGTKYKGQSVLNFGDISTISFHATKLFHTIEGGAVITNNPELNKKISLMRNFGHNGPECFEGIGINGKNSEVHAAMGLVNMKYVNDILRDREKSYSLYRELLPSEKLQFPHFNIKSQVNYSYLPVVFTTEEICLKVFSRLQQKKINPRRYFYPSLNKLSYTHGVNVKNAEDIASRILCLPLYYGLKLEEIQVICKVITDSI